MSGSFLRRWDAFDLEQFQPERFDLSQHAVQCGLVGQGAGQHRLLALRLRLQGGERGEHRPAEPTADADLVAHRSPAKREIENSDSAASRIEKTSTAANVPVNPESTPTPTTGMIRPA